jgi:predicted solute-binding protein
VALTRVLCRHQFHIDPTFVPHGPDIRGMLRTCDAGLLIGDPALDLDHAPLGVEKIDLGEAWFRMTGLPFIYAAWAGRPGAVTAQDVEALQEAQAEGVRAIGEIAREYARDDEAGVQKATAYLKDNVRYGLGPDEAAGLQLFLDYAADVGAASRRRRVDFF